MAAMTLNFTPLEGDHLATQIATQIRQMMAAGALRQGNKLPSTRSLAGDLGVARGTVVTALETLVAEGFLVTRRGAGTFVSSGCKLVTTVMEGSREPPARARIVTPDIDTPFRGPFNFQACRPSVDAFPQMAWRRAAAYASGRPPTSDYGDPQGEPALRVALAAYLCRARGLDVSADQIIVTNGALQAMQTLASLYLTPGTAVAFEDPGYPLARQMLSLTGATVLSVGVDEDGLCVERLPDYDANVRLIYVTPSHQFPTGQRLSLPRRQALLDWAAKHDALIMEDDYDGEFRYDIAPLPPLAAMSAGGSVVYFGTFSKTLFPSLRIGFAVGPKNLVREMASSRAVGDYQTNSLTQLTLAQFIDNGEFERHVLRMRRVYARKRELLAGVIERTGLDGQLSGIDSGLDALLRLNGQVAASTIADRARLQGICVTPIARYTQRRGQRDDALLLGYAAPTMQQIEQGIAQLADIIREANA